MYSLSIHSTQATTSDPSNPAAKLVFAASSLEFFFAGPTTLSFASTFRFLFLFDQLFPFSSGFELNSLVSESMTIFESSSSSSSLSTVKHFACCCCCCSSWSLSESEISITAWRTHLRFLDIFTPSLFSSVFRDSKLFPRHYQILAHFFPLVDTRVCSLMS